MQMYQLNQKYRTMFSILKELQRRGATSRPILAESLSLYSSTLSIRLKEMISLGLVQELEEGAVARSAGRKARPIELDPEFGYFGGIYLHQDGARLALFGSDLLLQKHWEVLYRNESAQPLEDALRDLIQLAGQGGLLSGGGTPQIQGIGIAVSSVVSSLGQVHPSSHYPWSGANLLALVRDLTGVKQLAIDNDANMAALADAYLLRQDESSLVHLLLLENVPTIGCGLYLNGDLYRGSTGAAGEVDEELWPLAKVGLPMGYLDQAARLIRFLAAFVDPDKICISGVVGSESLAELEKRFDDMGKRGSIKFITDPFWVEKGGAVKIFQKSVEALVGASK